MTNALVRLRRVTRRLLGGVRQAATTYKSRRAAPRGANADEATTAYDDSVSAAVRRGVRRRDRKRRRMGAAELAAARDISATVRRPADVDEAMERLLAFVEAFPADERPQTLIARLLEKFQDSAALAVWVGVDERFPQSRLAFRHRVRWVARLDGPDAARALVRLRFSRCPDDPEAAFAYGCALLELREGEEADKAFETVASAPRAKERTLVALARHYAALGLHDKASQILRPLIARPGVAATTTSLYEDVKAADATIRSALAEADMEKAAGDTRHAAIYAAFRRAGALRAAAFRPRSKDALGAVALVNGSLGPGGAERQFVNTALGLHSAVGRVIAGARFNGPVHVFCRSLGSRTGADFFASTLDDAGLEVREYESFPPELAAPIGDLIEHLPPQMRQGTLRMTAALRAAAPEVLHIWQDGSVLATGLAGVLAGVPRIILGVRTVAPIHRFERDKPEYDPVYRALLALEGVSLLANSTVVARSYEAWLGLPDGSVLVAPNGVEIGAMDGDAATRARAEAFFAGADPDAFVLGSVMRFDDNKRPLLWLDVAAALSSRDPSARFILVGDGPLLEAARAYAVEIGLAERVLFVGRSAHVAFWLGRMSAFLLLSRHEGLPNVLIEAQFAGVPVVATPAGGSAETVLPGQTGHILDSVDDVDPHRIADLALSWRRAGDERAALQDVVRGAASSRFSLAAMMELTVAAYLRA